MAVVKCIHCPEYYWSFRGDHPPKGYCSIKCFEERRRQKAKTGPPDAPQDVLMRMYRHRLEAHESTSILADFDCRECEALEAGYADSLSWHQAAAEKAMRAADRAGTEQ
jgi:hypothetical protein